MNWVGGVRNRVKFQNERKAQKEFFERKKLGVQQTGVRLKSLSTPHLKKHSVSQDLLALQTISHAHSNTKPGFKNSSKRTVRKLDLEGFRSTVTGRKYKEVELPTSPYETPSMLDLMEKDLETSQRSRSKSDSLQKQNEKVFQSHSSFNTRTKFSSLLSPKRNKDSLAHPGVLSFMEPSYKSIIQEKRHLAPQKDCAKSQTTCDSFGLNPFLHENCDITGNKMSSNFTVPCYTRPDLKPKPNTKSNSDQENNTYPCYSKCDYKSNKLLDERLHNLWVSEDFQTTPLIKYNGDKFQNDMLKKCSCSTYKSVDSKTWNDEYMSSQSHNSFDEEAVIYDKSVEIQSQDKNIFINHSEIDLPDEPDIYRNSEHDNFLTKNDYSVNKGDDKSSVFLNKLTPFFRTPNSDFHIDKQERKTACTTELDNSKPFEKMNQFRMHISQEIEKDISYSDSEYVWKKRKHLKNTLETGKINVCRNPIQNLHDVKKSETFDIMLKPLKVGQTERLWNSSELKVAETYYDKNKEVKDDILLKPEKLHETNFAENISAPVKYSSLPNTKERTGEVAKDESDDINCVAICTKEEYEQHWRLKCSPIDKVLNELIQLDNQDENVKNTSLSYNRCAATASSYGRAKKNTLTDMNQTHSQKDKDDKECIVEVIQTLVHKVVMQENTVDLSNTILPSCAWTKPKQVKKSLEVINLVFKENKTLDQNTHSKVDQLSDNSVKLLGLSKDKMLHKSATDQNLKNNNSKSDDPDSITLMKHQSEKLQSSPVITLVQRNEHKLVDASTSPIPPTTCTVDVCCQWETPESSQEVFVSADTQQEDSIDAVIDEDSFVHSCCMGIELSCQNWVVQDNCLDSQSQQKEQAYTLRPRKK